jgi:cell pole-organizing protein PopZ
MQRAPKATEPSMDEILASIRKIIAEDATGAAQSGPPRMPGTAPGTSPQAQTSPPGSGNRLLPDGAGSQATGERRRSAELDADLADLIGSLSVRGGALPAAPPPAEAAEPKLAPRPSAKTNGASGPPPAGATPASQPHRPLSEALERARAGARPMGDSVSVSASGASQAGQGSGPVPAGKAEPPAPSVPKPASSSERTGDPAVAAPAQPAAGSRHEQAGERAAATMPKVSDPAGATPAARSGADAPAREPDTSGSAAKSTTAKTAAQPAAPPDAVSMAAAAVARKVAATMPAQPVLSRPLGAARAGATPGEPTRTLEDMVAELLRPMLRQWLDTNMPRIVEKALRVEVADSAKPAKGSTSSGTDQS